MKRIVIVVLLQLSVVVTAGAQPVAMKKSPRRPIIDMHLHAEHVADYGPTPMACSDNRNLAWNAWDPRKPLDMSLLGTCDAGFAKRIRFGSDQMVWPQTIELAIETVESASFLSVEQKRDIFYNNAVRFLRIDVASGERVK